MNMRFDILFMTNQNLKNPFKILRTISNLRFLHEKLILHKVIETAILIIFEDLF